MPECYHSIGYCSYCQQSEWKHILVTRQTTQQDGAVRSVDHDDNNTMMIVVNSTCKLKKLKTKMRKSQFVNTPLFSNYSKEYLFTLW